MIESKTICGSPNRKPGSNGSVDRAFQDRHFTAVRYEGNKVEMLIAPKFLIDLLLMPFPAMETLSSDELLFRNLKP